MAVACEPEAIEPAPVDSSNNDVVAEGRCHVYKFGKEYLKLRTELRWRGLLGGIRHMNSIIK